MKQNTVLAERALKYTQTGEEEAPVYRLGRSE